MDDSGTVQIWDAPADRATMVRTPDYGHDGDPLRNAVRKLWRSNERTDFTIRCGGREWPVHSFVLCMQSKYFERAINGAFKESKTNIIELREDDPDIVDLMLAWFYLLNYPADFVSSKKSLKGSPVSEAEVHVRVFALAEKYLLDELMNEAGEGFLAQATLHWQSAGVARAIVDVYNMPSNTSKILRRHALGIVRIHGRLVLNPKSECSQHFRKALREAPVDFAVDVAETIGAQLEFNWVSEYGFFF